MKDSLQYTFECIDRVVSPLLSARSAVERFEGLHQNSIHWAKGGRLNLNERQTETYTDILSLMYEGGREFGARLTMSDVDMSQCSQLWLSLLTSAAARAGADRPELYL